MDIKKEFFQRYKKLFLELSYKFPPEVCRKMLINALFLRLKNKKTPQKECFKRIFDDFEFSLDEKEEDKITPNMLEKVFEELIPRGEKKKKGAFYTPSEITESMAEECFSAYLKENGSLENIKIFDPATGAGAFPVKILNKIAQYSKGEEFETKLNALRNSIFGSDIEKEAVRITKLRLWLSLKNSAPNGAKLPSWVNFNIENKNSLLDFRENYFDIVIGNPPYVGEKGHREIFEAVKSGALKEFYFGKMDYFYFFFHLALNILKPGGICAFITTNYYVTAHGARLLRKDLKERATLKKLINFNEQRLFNSAKGHHSLITIFSKGQNNGAKCRIINPNETFEISQEKLYEGKESYIRLFGECDEIFEKMARNSETLGEICKINNGVHTEADRLSAKKQANNPNKKAGDGIYVLDGTREEDFEVIKKIRKAGEGAYLKPFFKNSDIKKYKTIKTTDKFLIYINKKKDDIGALPAIRAHLADFKEIIEAASDNAPYLHRPKREEIFTAEKIVTPHRSAANTFAYSKTPFYASADVYFITEPKEGYSLKYILALLNSSLYLKWFTHRGKRKGETLELYRTPLSETPIKKAPRKIQTELENLVDKILKNPDKEAEYQKKINEIVDKLYT